MTTGATAALLREFTCALLDEGDGFGELAADIVLARAETPVRPQFSPGDLTACAPLRARISRAQCARNRRRAIPCCRTCKTGTVNNTFS